MISLLTPFATYLVAEEIHVSGVLAVVAAGLYLGRRAPRIGSAQARLQGDAVWGMIVFLLNGLIFILIGLQLPTVLDGLEQTDSVGTLAYYAVAVSVTAIVVRVLWVYPATYLPRLLFRSIRERDPSPSPRHVAIVAWTGMRGVVSLAAALALGPDVPQRELLIFLTFCVILATLVLQGLTLPLLIRVLRVGAEADTEHEETEARLRASQAALTRLEQLAGDDSAPEDLIDRLRIQYERRTQSLATHKAALIGTDGHERTRVYEQLQNEMIDAERATVLQLRDDGVINDEILHRIQRDLDIERTRLDE